MKFTVTKKIKGFHYVIDEDNNKVGLRGKDSKLRAKKFKTYLSAEDFAEKLAYASNMKKEEK